MEEWEYRVYTYHPGWAGGASFEEQLNNWHKKWELVTVIPIEKDQRECIFKRKIQQR